MSIASIESCTHCGSDEGYYTKDYVKGHTVTRFTFDGSEAENTDMYEGLSHRMGKVAYCLNCHKRLFKMEEALGHE